MTINAGFSYNLNIPATNNNPSTDQPNMLTNTNSISSIIGTDHITFGANNGGIHKVIRFQDQGSSVPAAIAGFGQLYTNTLVGDQQLFYESGGGVVTQLTGPNAAVAATNGYTWLPGGILIQWGTVGSIVTGGTPTVVLFATSNINFPNACFNIQMTLDIQGTGGTTNAQTIALVDKTALQFRYNYSGGSAYNRFYWVAIGN